MPFSPLGRALTARWALEDHVPVLLIGTLHISWLILSYHLLGPHELTVMLLLTGLEVVVVLLNAFCPALYLRYLLPLITSIRLLSGTFPMVVDISRMASRAGASAVAGCAAAGGSTAAATAAASTCAATVGDTASDKSSILRAVGQLLLPIAWLHSLFLAPLCIHLPPLAHIVVQTSSVVLLMGRANTACERYAAQHNLNAQLASGLHWALRQVVSLLCPGTREHLAAAAAATSSGRKCTAVVWSLQASLGFVLPTLLCWRMQLGAVQRHDAEQEQQWLAQQRQRRGGSGTAAASGGDLLARLGVPGTRQRRQQDWGPPPEVDRSFMRSEYRLMCEPVLSAAASIGWAVVACGAALVAWVAAVLRNSHLSG